MNRIPVCAAIAGSIFSMSAHAALSPLQGTCPGDVAFRVEANDTVTINGKKATLKRFSDDYHEAKDAGLGLTISILRNPDGRFDVSYTGKNRANGVCAITGASAESAAVPAPAGKRETHPVAEKACLSAVAAKTNVAVGKLSVVEALSAEAGILVTVTVPGADAPWACMTDAKGKPWSVNFTGSEGKL